MVRPALFAALLLSLAAPAATQERELTADVRMHKIESKHLPVPRDLVICLPPGYEADTSRRYPVLYMHDGSNVHVEWKLDEVVRTLVAAGTIEPVILALIPNGGAPEDRYNDYTPTKPANVKAGGKADAYGRMLVEEVKPFVDATLAGDIKRLVKADIKADIERALMPVLYRLAALEAKPTIKYCGTHEPGKAYVPGDGVTYDGSLWVCRTATSAKPGDDYNGWQLAARKGRDGRR